MNQLLIKGARLCDPSQGIDAVCDLSLIHIWLHRGEEQHVADRNTVGQQHHHAVDANADAACRRHAVFERGEEILIDVACLLVSGSLHRGLVFKASALVDRVVEFGEGVRMLTAQDEQLEPLGVFRVGGFALGKR